MNCRCCPFSTSEKAQHRIHLELLKFERIMLHGNSISLSRIRELPPSILCLGLYLLSTVRVPQMPRKQNLSTLLSSLPAVILRCHSAAYLSILKIYPQIAFSVYLFAYLQELCLARLILVIPGLYKAWSYISRLLCQGPRLTSIKKVGSTSERKPNLRFECDVSSLYIYQLSEGRRGVLFWIEFRISAFEPSLISGAPWYLTILTVLVSSLLALMLVLIHQGCWSSVCLFSLPCILYHMLDRFHPEVLSLFFPNCKRQYRLLGTSQ